MIHDLRNEEFLLIDPSRWEQKCKALDELDFNAHLVARPLLDPAKLTQEMIERVELVGSAVRADCDDTDWWGDPIPKMEIIGNVAIIPLVGILVCGYPDIFKRFGYCDAMDIRDWINQANANPVVQKIIIQVDSPGGMVTGIREVAAAVQNSKKRIVVFSDSGMCCSAAYWICCGAYSIVGTPSSSWGSIGAYSQALNSKKAYDQMGLVAKIFRSGKFKGMGLSGTDLSAEQEAYLQSRTDDIGAEFRTAVKSFRPIADEFLQGQWYDGQQAAALGFIDDVVANINEAIALR